jgi:hypothetical protein
MIQRAFCIYSFLFVERTHDYESGGREFESCPVRQLNQ